MKRSAIALLISGSLCGAETIAITNARVYPVTSAPVDNATVLIRDGRIAAVGGRVDIPKDARRIDASGLSVYPGWIDSWSYVGLAEISSVPGSVDISEIGRFNPGEQAWIAVNPHSEMIRTARVNGVGTALIAPSGGLVAGGASAINLLGEYPADMAILKNAGVVVNIPSLYSPPLRRQRRGPAPETAEERKRRVQDEFETLKHYLQEAKRYAEMRTRGGATLPKASIDDAFEGLLPVMRGERPMICPADHFRDIETAVALSEELGVKLIIAGGADAWKVADLLARKNVGVLYTNVNELPLNPEDPYDVSFSTPEVLRRAGVRFAIATGSVNDVRNLPYQAAMAAAYGLEREDAMKAITLWPAELIGVANQVGSVETGKLANLVVTRGDPLDVRSEVRYVFINGREVPPENRNLEMYREFGRRRKDTSK